MKLLIYLLACGWLLTIAPAQAQLERTLRLELPVNPNTEESYDVMPLGERGVLVSVHHNDYYSSAPLRFSFRRLDANLKELWTTDYKIESYFEPVRSFLSDHYAFWLFVETGSEKITVLRLNLEDGHTEVYRGKMLAQMEVLQFKVLDNIAYIGGNYRNRPMVVAFSFFDQSAKVLPGLYVNHIQLNNIEVDAQRRLVHVMIDATQQRNCDFSILTYNYEGRLLRTLNLNGQKHSIISGKLLPLNEEESLLIGNYSLDCTPYSQGIYVSRVKAGDTEPTGTRYINFSELQNFFNYLKPRQQQKMLDKISRRQKEGKDVKFRYRLLVHDLIPTDDGLVLLAEVYYPQYKGSSSSFLFANGRTFDRSQDGYRYTHAFLCSFDQQGNLVWDNSVSIPDLTSYKLHPMVQVSRQGERLVVGFPQNGEIKTEVLERGKIVGERQHYSLKEDLSENEKIVTAENEHLEAWYGQHFLACGFQKISNQKTAGPPRQVFYLNKLTYGTGGKPAPGSAHSPASRKTSGSER